MNPEASPAAAAPAASSPGADAPALLVTGASGLVGRHFVAAARERFRIYAVARRGQVEAEVPSHPNVRWLRCDLADGRSVARLAEAVAAEARVDFVFHFAGYYDFEGRDSPEYRRTNVEGTRHVLAAAERLAPRRFVFASSLAVSEHRDPRRVIDERTPPDAPHPYARSKREAEALVAAAAGRFPCTVARLAAVYSDWCEYAPLYVLLNTWLAGGVRGRLIAGRGRTALPYVHVDDLACFWLRVLDRHAALAAHEVLAASPSECVSHDELYLAATQGYDEGPKPIHVPRPLALAGVVAGRLAARLAGRRPFERPWMLGYVDHRMRVDARRTHALLGWAPRPRFHLMRRLLFLIENMKRDPATWERRNLAMTKQAVPEHPELRIYNAMVELRPRVIAEHVAYLVAPEHRGIFPSYQRLGEAELRLRAELMYQTLETSLRLGDHYALLAYANHLARSRWQEGTDRHELTGSLEHLGDRLEAALRREPGLAGLHRTVHFDIGIAMQLVLDEIEDTYDRLGAGSAGGC